MYFNYNYVNYDWSTYSFTLKNLVQTSTKNRKKEPPQYFDMKILRGSFFT
jgi:hypothetical protein